jgi:cytochrome o ubiquinol oxidase subunit IV
MSAQHSISEQYSAIAPGDRVRTEDEPAAGVLGYLLGLILSLLLTAASFGLVGTKLIWAPGIPVALAVLAVAQMGVHLVFFLHINSGPDHANNILALAFGVLIIAIVISGSLWIMYHLNHNMMPMETMTDLRFQH